MANSGVTIDPEGSETRVLHDLVDFAGTDVVEVGCGDGRMTWRYAGSARSVLGLDPNEARIVRAIQQTPETLQSSVTFRAGDVESVTLPDAAFDMAILSWSL
jgi:ubiquinone/menaquinone biosynthesis C-methylase UbiE